MTAGDIEAALAAAKRAGSDSSLEAAAALAQGGWLPETPRTRGARGNPCSRPIVQCPTGCACKALLAEQRNGGGDYAVGVADVAHMLGPIARASEAEAELVPISRFPT